MDGVILFADDMVFQENTPENRLFLELSKDHAVLPVNTLELANRAIKSIGTFSAMILDWEFREELGGVAHIRNPNVLLDNSHFYSLVYVFSNLQIPEATRRRLRKKFPGRIIFKRKSASAGIARQLQQNVGRITNDMEVWRNANPNEIIPQNWGISINQSIQQIFTELSKADSNWIVEISNSAGNDTNKEMAVIGLLQSLLYEKIITDQSLIQSIKALTNNPPTLTSQAGVGELFQRIYYSDLREMDLPTCPVMTGDVFKISNRPNTFGIIVTPECDIKKVVSNNDHTFQVLKFKRHDFREFAKRRLKWQNLPTMINQGDRKSILKWFNQSEESVFFLPSFPFTSTLSSAPAIIDFTNCVGHYSYNQLRLKDRICKLNSPFVQQLRQKYLSYVGRVGVPTIPEGLRTINIGGFL